MKTVRTLIAAGIVALLMGGCDDGDNASPVVKGNGLWYGTQTIGSDIYEVGVISYDGRLVGLSPEANILFAGSYSVDDNNFTSSYNIYDEASGAFGATGTFSGALTENTLISGNFSNSWGEDGSMLLTFRPEYHQPSSLDYISYHYNSGLTISSDGNISGDTMGCMVSGSVTIPDASVNLYEIAFHLSDCIYAGDYDGLGSILLDGNTTSFMGGASNASYMAYFRYQIPEVWAP